MAFVRYWGTMAKTDNHQLAIINKKDREGFLLNGETVTMHCIHKQILDQENVISLETFSVLDDSRCIQCKPTIQYIPRRNHATFLINFITKVPDTYEYDVSLYYVNKESKLVHLKTLNVNNMSGNKEVSFSCYEVFSKQYLKFKNSVEFTNLLNDSFIFYTKFTRTDIPYIYKTEPDVLPPSQITDCSLLFENDTFSNFSIIVDDKEFHVHKEILAAKSRVFLVMFQTEMMGKKENQVKIEDMDSEVFQEMLRYIYKNSVNDLSTHAEKLFRAAEKYELHNLKMLCTDALTRSLKVENAVATLVLADQYNESTLRERTIKFIKGNIKSVLQTEEYRAWYRSASPALLGDILEAVVLS